jgi:hypothetical protein
VTPHLGYNNDSTAKCALRFLQWTFKTALMQSSSLRSNWQSEFGIFEDIKFITFSNMPSAILNG